MLRNAASSMSGSMLRLGGSEGDVVCYDVPEFNMTCEMMNQTDPAMCLSMTRYKELVSILMEYHNTQSYSSNQLAIVLNGIDML